MLIQMKRMRDNGGRRRRRGEEEEIHESAIPSKKGVCILERL